MKRQHLPLNALRAFEAAARLGTMKAAAAELGVTPGAVSRQIALLEETIGLALFAGSRIRPELTPTGEALLPGLTDAFDQIQETLQKARHTASVTLDVQCLGSFSLRWLIPRLDRFQSQHPDITLRLTTTASPEKSGRNTSEQFDLSIFAEIDTPGPGDLFSEQLGPVAAPALLTGNTPITPAELLQLPRLTTRTRRDVWTFWCAACNLPEVEAKADGRDFEHYYYTLQAAIAGLGVAIAPYHLVADDLVSGRLIAPFGFLASGYQYRLHQKSASATATAFIQWLRQELAESILAPTSAQPAAGPTPFVPGPWVETCTGP
jgi:DNA-binding transcriptional LysR family regulator